MNYFQLFLIFNIGIIFSKTVHVLWESVFLFKKIDYYLYFFFCGIFVTLFLFMNFLLTLELSEDSYLIINRWMLFSQNIMMIFWILAFYSKYFKRSKIPFVFIATSTVLLCTLPFDIFISNPAIFVNGSLSGSPFKMAFSTPNIMYYIYDLNLFSFFSIVTVFMFIKSGLRLKDKILSILAFSPGILFLIDLIAYLYIGLNYVDNSLWSGFYLVFLVIVFTTLFLMPNIESQIRITDKISTMEKNNRYLEELVKERTKEIENKNRQKTDLFINLVHEFKTPLSLIRNYLEEYISKKGPDPDLQIIKRNINKMSNDFMNFMDTERLEMGKQLVSDDMILDVSACLSDTITLFKKYSSRKNIAFIDKIFSGIHIKIGTEAFDRIINNLLENAVKFTNPGGLIILSVEIRNSKAVISVSDNGIGIPKENLDNIFLPYYQISRNKNNIQGLGMGLHIVKGIIEQSGGMIDVKSSLGNGTTFEVTFPLCKPVKIEKKTSFFKSGISYPEPEINVQIKDIPHDRMKKTLLTVEDNNNLLACLVNALNKRYNVLHAPSALAALDIISNNQKIDLIISDIMMDGMDGYEFVGQLRKSAKSGNIPFIFLTARTSTKDIKQGLSLGAIDFITKPFSIELLEAKITSIFENIDNIHNRSIKKLKDRVIGILDDSDINENIEPLHVDCNYFVREFNLTERETQVFRYMVDGKINKEMADLLNISVSSVKKYIFNIYRKLGVNNRLELNNKLYGNEKN